jgi:hypothetical protein
LGAEGQPRSAAGAWPDAGDTLADPKRLAKFKGVEGEKLAITQERGELRDLVVVLRVCVQKNVEMCFM